MDTNVVDMPSRDGVAEPVKPISAHDNRNIQVEVVDSSENNEYLADGLRLLVPTDFEFLAEDDPYPIRAFKLVQTSIRLGKQVSAQVRVVNLADRTVLDTLPPKVRALTDRLMFNTNAPLKVTGRLRNEQTLDRLKELCYATACAGFVSPKLVLDKNEEDPENMIWWVGRIAFSDLHEFWRICEGNDDLAARRLESFLE